MNDRLHEGPPLTIGAVVFHDPSGTYVPLMGQERVVALRAFYRGEPIPGGLIPHADWYHHGGRLQHKDVLWETAGERVTG